MRRSIQGSVRVFLSFGNSHPIKNEINIIMRLHGMKIYLRTKNTFQKTYQIWKNEFSVGIEIEFLLFPIQNVIQGTGKLDALFEVFLVWSIHNNNRGFRMLPVLADIEIYVQIVVRLLFEVQDPEKCFFFIFHEEAFLEILKCMIFCFLITF